MQLITMPESEKLPLIEKAIQKERLERYMPAADNDIQIAFEFYLWNCALCEAFYIPLHFMEIVFRNIIHNRLISCMGSEWYEDKTFRLILKPEIVKDLEKIIKRERRQHGINFTSHHIVSALSLGFWQHLMTNKFDRLLWKNGVRCVLPNAPSYINREHIFKHIESVRLWRNRISHHSAIFDKGSMKHHQEIIDLIKWICVDTGEWVASISKVPLIISLRPKR